MSNMITTHTPATLFEASKLPCACDPGMKPAWIGARVAAPAFTVRGIGGDNLALHNAVLAAPAGSVLVIDLQGAENGHWGEVLAVAAQHRGIAGLVIDGGVRDVDEMKAMDFPVFSRSVTVVGTVKSYPGDLGGPVRVGGITVNNGDLVVGGADGVIVLPAHAVESTIANADARMAEEERIIAEIRSGASTLDLYSLPGSATAAAVR